MRRTQLRADDYGNHHTTALRAGKWAISTPKGGHIAGKKKFAAAHAIRSRFSSGCRVRHRVCSSAPVGRHVSSSVRIGNLPVARENGHRFVPSTVDFSRSMSINSSSSIDPLLRYKRSRMSFFLKGLFRFHHTSVPITDLRWWNADSLMNSHEKDPLKFSIN